MQYKKISITSTEVGKLTFPVSAIEAPSFILIAEAKARPRYDGKEQINGSCAKIALSGVDLKLAQLMKQQGLELQGLVPIYVELVGEESFLKQFKPENMVNTVIDIRNAQVALRWISRGSSGSWGGLKLIISEFNPVKPKQQ